MKQPSPQTAIDTLSVLLEKTDPAILAYFVAPNTVLTLSGARAYCDGVFYHDDLSVLKTWLNDINTALKIIESITDVYFMQAEISKNPARNNYAAYDLILTQGLEYIVNTSDLIGPEVQDIAKKDMNGEQLIDFLTNVLKNNKNLSGLNDVNLRHVAFGIILGYPDKAITELVGSWDDNYSTELFVDANIRGASYYTCPQPIYQYPRHLVKDQQINRHEQLWSDILTDFYKSKFHKDLLTRKEFKEKLRQLKMLRS